MNLYAKSKKLLPNEDTKFTFEYEMIRIFPFLITQHTIMVGSKAKSKELLFSHKLPLNGNSSDKGMHREVPFKPN